MTVKDLMDKLDDLAPDTKLVIMNDMGMPAYDYENQKFAFKFDKQRKALVMTKEIMTKEIE